MHRATSTVFVCTAALLLHAATHEAPAAPRPPADATRPAADSARPPADAARPTTDSAHPAANPAHQAAAPSDPAAAGELLVVSVSPAPHAGNVAIDTPVAITFDQPVDPLSISLNRTFAVFGRWSGATGGQVSFADDDRTVILTPDWPFSAGESVTITLSHDVRTPDGVRLRDEGYSCQFWTKAKTANRNWVEIDRLFTAPDGHTQPYGGIATDLDRDRFLDITTVNEVTGDLRVFMNRADYTGLFDDFLRPTFRVNQRASPSEPADFNGDGIADICVANIDTDTVSILLGVGDGTFHPQQQVNVGNAPRGIAVLDVDGDGDADIVNTNSASNNLSLLINDGAGVFSHHGFIEGGCGGEWALSAGDMNHDGLLDLVVGCSGSQQVSVLLNDGDRTFTPAGLASSDGQTWMLVLGDVDGNATLDVALVNGNSSPARGAILLGNGAGGVSAPTRYLTDPFPLATDLADLDGDGDMDWVTSSFSGDWRIFTNLGLGQFQHTQTLPSPLAASCSLPMDMDNDGDLDLALIDERADLILLMKNGGTTLFPGDLTFDCRVNASDYRYLAATCLSGPGACAPPACGVFDFDGDCDVDAADFAGFQAAFTDTGTLPGCVP
jgi:hypothetical protein